MMKETKGGLKMDCWLTRGSMNVLNMRVTLNDNNHDAWSRNSHVIENMEWFFDREVERLNGREYERIYQSPKYRRHY